MSEIANGSNMIINMLAPVLRFYGDLTDVPTTYAVGVYDSHLYPSTFLSLFLSATGC